MRDDDKLKAALLALKDPAAPKVGTFWRHAKTNAVYMVCGGAVWEPTCEAAVAYRGRDGVVWLRPLAAFADGRFAAAEQPADYDARGYGGEQPVPEGD